MTMLKSTLRRVVEVRIVRFGLVKTPLTLASWISFLTMRHFEVDLFWAVFCNSLAIQTFEFCFQKFWVFREKKKDFRIVSWEALKFAAGVLLFAPLEGSAVEQAARFFPLNDIGSYVVGHVPIFFLRYVWDRSVVFPDPNNTRRAQ